MHDLVPFAKLKKREKHLRRSITSSKVGDWSLRNRAKRFIYIYEEIVKNCKNKIISTRNSNNYHNPANYIIWSFSRKKLHIRYLTVLWMHIWFSSKKSLWRYCSRSSVLKPFKSFDFKILSEMLCVIWYHTWKNPMEKCCFQLQELLLLLHGTKSRKASHLPRVFQKVVLK